MPDAPLPADPALNKPEQVEPVVKPVNTTIEPSAISAKTLDPLVEITLPALTQEVASDPTDPVDGLGDPLDVSDIVFDSDEVTDSTKPSAPIELNDLEDVTGADPLEKPKELEQIPDVQAPSIPEIVAPDLIDPTTPTVEKTVVLTAPTDPAALEAPVASAEAQAPTALVDPKKKAEEQTKTGVLTTTKTGLVARPSSSKLPNTRSERKLPNTGSETSLLGQGMGSFMAGAAGSLLFWRRKKGKHNK